MIFILSFFPLFPPRPSINGTIILDAISLSDIGWYQCYIIYNGDEYSSVAYFLNVQPRQVDRSAHSAADQGHATSPDVRKSALKTHTTSSSDDAVFSVEVDEDETNEVDDYGEPINGDTLLVMMSSDEDAVPFKLPPHGRNEFWSPLLDSDMPDELPKRMWEGDEHVLQRRGLAVFVLKRFRVPALAKLLHAKSDRLDAA